MWLLLPRFFFLCYEIAIDNLTIYFTCILSNDLHDSMKDLRA